MKQFTFWNENDTKEHVTLRFDSDGTVSFRSRDKRRSVRDRWPIIGRWQVKGTVKLIEFFDAFPFAWVAVTRLARTGWTTWGAGYVALEASVTSRETNKVTDPETLLGRKRRRSLDLGIKSVASGACDTVEQMRGKVLVRQATKRARKLKASL